LRDIARVEGYQIIPELCISGKNYIWEDSVALIPIAMGERISDDYNSAALIFEFITALAEENIDEYGGIQEILDTTVKYFSLVNEELAKLNVLVNIFSQEARNLDNLGECLRTWIKTEDREYIRNVIFEILNLSGDLDDSTKQISEKLHQVLDIQADTFEKLTTPPFQTGERLVSVLSTLFKNK
jgi:uncharacterized tellurite resistance protein B-like protein